MNDPLAALPPLRESLAAHGLAAKKSFGQHFLLDLNITRKIARLAGGGGGGTGDEGGGGRYGDRGGARPRRPDPRASGDGRLGDDCGEGRAIPSAAGRADGGFAQP